MSRFKINSNKEPSRSSRWVIVLIVIIVLTSVVVSTGVLLKTLVFDRHKVSFLDADGNFIAQYRVKDGYYVKCDKNMRGIKNKVFKGWSEELGPIKDDVAISPVYHNIEYLNNVFYIETYYADRNSKFCVDLKIGGTISAKKAKIGVAFDNITIECTEVKTFFSNEPVQTEEKYVTLMFDIPDTIETGSTLATFYFESKDVRFVKTDLPIDLLNIQYNDVSNMESNSIRGLVYIY